LPSQHDVLGGTQRESSMDILDRLLDHDAWTTRQLLLRCRELDAARLHQPFDVGHETIYETLLHMIGNVRTWTDLMNGDARPGAQSPHDGLSVDELIARHDAAMNDFATLARRTRAEGRFDDTWLDTLDEPPTRKTYGGAIAHVITHNMHHRSELLHILQRLGVPILLEGDVLSWEYRNQATTA
jgi:uncharacterized damage-inducible protein DinB